MSIQPALLSFLDELAQNNVREWFEANKPRYEADVKEPLLAFIDSFAPELAKVSPAFEAIGQGKGSSMFRIHRDTRFSKDKTPYKTHAALQFRHHLGSNDVHAPGFYFHLEPGNASIGAGTWSPEPGVIHRLRAAIVADAEGWREIWAAATAGGWGWFGTDALVRPPKGFAPDHEHIEALKRKSFAVMRSIPVDEVYQEDFPVRLAGYYNEIAPLVAFQCEALELPF